MGMRFVITVGDHSVVRIMTVVIVVGDRITVGIMTVMIAVGENNCYNEIYCNFLFVDKVQHSFGFGEKV